MGEAGDALLQEVAFYQRGRSYHRFASILFFLFLSPLSSISPLSWPSHSSTWMMILKPRRKVSHFRNCSSTQNESGPKQLSSKGINWRQEKMKKANPRNLAQFLLVNLLPFLSFRWIFQASSNWKTLGLQETSQLGLRQHKNSQWKINFHKYTNEQIQKYKIQKK